MAVLTAALGGVAVWYSDSPPARSDPVEQPAVEDAVPAEIGPHQSEPTQMLRKAIVQRINCSAPCTSAVELGLEWLIKQQQPDGSWSLQGPFSNGAPFEDREAATAMALLALEGDGHTPQRGKYRSQVTKGIEYLLTLQDKEGNFFHGERKHNWLYSHALCTIALCELYGMTADEQFREPAQRAIEFAIDAQHEKGGWRYSPRTDRDTAVTGWMVMALTSGRLAGLTVPQETFDRTGNYLDEASSEGGTRYAYQPGIAADEVMTAEALLCRKLIGWPKADERLAAGADLLVKPENLPNWDNRNVYYWFFATQTLHDLEYRRWVTWNDVLRDSLPPNQVTTGPEAGSWHPLAPQPDRWSMWGGRLYTTCLSICTLEVYYRHLPLYNTQREGD